MTIQTLSTNTHLQVTPAALEQLAEELRNERRVIAAVLDGGICIISPEIKRLCDRRERLACAAALATTLAVSLSRLGAQ